MTGLDLTNLLSFAKAKLSNLWSFPNAGVARPRARIGAALTVSPSGDRVYLSGGWGTVLQGSVNVTEAPGTPDEVYSELNRHAGLLVRWAYPGLLAVQACHYALSTCFHASFMPFLAFALPPCVSG